ncbi:hypothetical protein BD324DRAFT_617840 [Kockovaella imperatae]|uniref:trimethyllysine dioxygenase n=1 Tax=Kockovaella imperatae TaxID=4999 RepID=A0A1Y1ULP3_9TREE|nr:hypothetical protein BD324DRAFT_617840 [Kockovaella imperatae]ORX38902.1 hypothetical protein BD324DRAFT_617840 [Kockovaella imperatae]
MSFRSGSIGLLRAASSRICTVQCGHTQVFGPTARLYTTRSSLSVPSSRASAGRSGSMTAISLERRHYASKRDNYPPKVSLKNNVVDVEHRGRSLKLSAAYLLDHCRCSKCSHAKTKQRLKTLSEVDPNVFISELTPSSDGITVQWHGQDGHTALFPWRFWARLVEAQSPQISSKILWDNKIASKPPSIDYERLMPSSAGEEEAEKAVLEWISKVDQYGFCFVNGVPATPEATEELINRIGTIRQTHYGGFWDFTADMSLGDLAYSSQQLPAHTDSTYFTDPSGLQIFHLLSHPPPGEGGHTLLVDGFKAALQLEHDQPGMYQTLSTVPVPHHASGNQGLMYRTCRPVLTVTHEEGDESLEMVRWNNEDRGVLVDRDGWDEESTVEVWYEAAREFERILRSRENEYWVKLQPGTVCVIDNWRVLHGRSSFTGSRRMCGAYVGRDDWRSRLWTLQRRFSNTQKDDLWDFGW